MNLIITVEGINSTIPSTYLRRSGTQLTMFKQLKSMLRKVWGTRKSNPSTTLFPCFFSLLNLGLLCAPSFLCTFLLSFFFYLWVTCQVGIIPTLVVFTLFPEEQLHPLRSGRTLHSSPSRHGCMWHHHFCSTIEATREENKCICILLKWTL